MPVCRPHAVSIGCNVLQAVHTLKENVAANLRSLHIQMDDLVSTANSMMSKAEERLVQLLQKVRYQQHVVTRRFTFAWPAVTTKGYTDVY